MTAGLGKLGIVAGAGAMPLQIVRACEAEARSYFVVAVDEFAQPLAANVPHERIRISKIGASIRALLRNGCREVVFAGKLERPDGGRVKLRPDWGGLIFLLRVFGNLGRHDDALHRAINAMFSKRGLKVVSPLTAVPALAARSGCLTKTEPSPALKASFGAALLMAKAHGATRRGQAVVVRNGEVVASEGRAGTDAMLQALSGAKIDGGMLVKAMAPAQLPTIDPPAIGESTIVHAAAAGLSGILVEAGRSVIVDEAKVRAVADEKGLFVYAGRADD